MESNNIVYPRRIRIPFSKNEDTLLVKLVKQYGESNWQKISLFMNNRTVRQCRERWQNSLSPTILKKEWTSDEDELLLEKYRIHGPHWKLIESFFIGRTSYALRNRFRSIQKKLSEKFNNTQNQINSDLGKDELKNEQKDFINASDLHVNDYVVGFNYDFHEQDEFDFEIFNLYGAQEN